MQKKLIALAIAGLMSAPAFAQSNVTLYGTIDYGYAYLGGSDINGTKIRHAIDSGISKANRIGFKGTEDLGNGLKAVFVLEEGMQGDFQGMFKGNARQTYAGLAGGFGTVAFGRHYTPQHLFTSAVDPFGKNGLGSAGNTLVQERRLNNLLAYISPSWGGFSFIAGWTFNGTRGGPYGGGDEKVENDQDIRAWALAPSFTWNNLFVGANYHTAKVHQAHASDVKALNVLDLYASYDFGFVKLGTTIGRRTTKKAVFTTDYNSSILQWMVGATFKITPSDSILTSFSQAAENKVNNIQPEKARIRQFAIGYEHALSKRTALYFQGAKQWHSSGYKDNNGWFGALETDGPVGSVASTYNDTGAADGIYRNGFAIGLRHDF